MTGYIPHIKQCEVLHEVYIFPDYKCPMCGCRYEDCGSEEFKAGWRIEFCGNCGYVFNVE